MRAQKDQPDRKDCVRKLGILLFYLVCLKTLKSYIPNGRKAFKMNSVFIAITFVARVYIYSKYSCTSATMS